MKLWLSDDNDCILFFIPANSISAGVSNITLKLKTLKNIGKQGFRSPKFIWAPYHVMCTAVLIG